MVESPLEKKIDAGKKILIDGNMAFLLEEGEQNSDTAPFHLTDVAGRTFVPKEFISSQELFSGMEESISLDILTRSGIDSGDPNDLMRMFKFMTFVNANYEKLMNHNMGWLVYKQTLYLTRRIDEYILKLIDKNENNLLVLMPPVIFGVTLMGGVEYIDISNKPYFLQDYVHFKYSKIVPETEFHCIGASTAMRRAHTWLEKADAVLEQGKIHLWNVKETIVDNHSKEDILKLGFKIIREKNAVGIPIVNEFSKGYGTLAKSLGLGSGDYMGNDDAINANEDVFDYVGDDYE